MPEIEKEKNLRSYNLSIFFEDMEENAKGKWRWW